MKRQYTTGKPEKSQFHNKAGDLTPYAFACGYVERYTQGEDRLTLSREPNGWHTKGFIAGAHVWEIFDKLGNARKFCRKQQSTAATS